MEACIGNIAGVTALVCVAFAVVAYFIDRLYKPQAAVTAHRDDKINPYGAGMRRVLRAYIKQHGEKAALPKGLLNCSELLSILEDVTLAQVDEFICTCLVCGYAVFASDARCTDPDPDRPDDAEVHVECCCECQAGEADNG